MRSLRIALIIFVSMFLSWTSAHALKGVTATDEDVRHLRNDLRSGQLKVGISRMKDFVQEYGEPTKKVDGDRKMSLEYGDLKVEFDRRRYWREWSYDSFKRPAYTDKINTLRKKLESKKIEGENILIEKFIKDYDEPTEVDLAANDGEISLFYYGDIRLTFENVYKLRSWEAKNLEGSSELQTPKALPAAKNEKLPEPKAASKAPEAPAAKPVAK